MNMKKDLKCYEINIDELNKIIYKFIAKANVEMDGNVEAETMVGQARILANDIKINNKFKNMYVSQIQDAFYEGVRDITQTYLKLNIPTYFRWLIKHKETVDYAEHQVHRLNVNPKQVKYYYEPKKLLK
tara:strand:- start:1570 stop:1956 length:387 start_codon:yes stop_codon:yes gene_type:complete